MGHMGSLLMGNIGAQRLSFSLEIPDAAARLEYLNHPESS